MKGDKRALTEFGNRSLAASNPMGITDMAQYYDTLDLEELIEIDRHLPETDVLAKLLETDITDSYSKGWRSWHRDDVVPEIRFTEGADVVTPKKIGKGRIIAIKVEYVTYYFYWEWYHKLFEEQITRLHVLFDAKNVQDYMEGTVPTYKMPKKFKSSGFRPIFDWMQNAAQGIPNKTEDIDYAACVDIIEYLTI